MDPSLSIASMPKWLSAILFIILPVMLAFAVPILIRKKIPLERLKVNNEVAGFKYATVGVIYAVVLAFVVIVVWEDYRNAEECSQQEAVSLVSIHRLANAFPGAIKTSLHNRTIDYTESILRDEWPFLAKGQASPRTEEHFRHLFTAVTRIDPVTENQKSVYRSMLDSLVKAGEQRRERVGYAAMAIPTILWVTLAIGAVVVIGFTIFFGSPNVWVQATQAALVALMILLSLYVIASMDHPFTGTTSVDPTTYETALETMRQIH